MSTTKKSTGPTPMTHATGTSLATLEWQIDTHDTAELNGKTVSDVHSSH